MQKQDADLGDHREHLTYLLPSALCQLVIAGQAHWGGKVPQAGLRFPLWSAQHPPLLAWPQSLLCHFVLLWPSPLI